MTLQTVQFPAPLLSGSAPPIPWNWGARSTAWVTASSPWLQKYTPRLITSRFCFFFSLPFHIHFAVIGFIVPWSVTVFGNRPPSCLYSCAFQHYLLFDVIEDSCVHTVTSGGLLNCKTSWRQCLIYIDVFSLLHDTCLQSCMSFGSLLFYRWQVAESQNQGIPLVFCRDVMCEYGVAPKTVPVAAEECRCLNSHLLLADTLFKCYCFVMVICTCTTSLSWEWLIFC